MITLNKRLKIFTWHVHGNYMYYLSHANCNFYLPKKSDDAPGYGGRAGSFPWGDNVIEIPAEKVREYDFDCILYQNAKNYNEDQYEVLSAEQRKLPKIYLEHDPPQEHPTNTKHFVHDPNVLLVHVTHFNNLMWNAQQTPTTVIDHGVFVPSDIQYTGGIEKGIVIVNNLPKRGRRLGLDIVERVRKAVPLDIVGMGSEEIGGLGEVQQNKLPAFIAKYRFFFHPVRYTSLGLSVIEALMVGVPIVGLATTELVTTIRNGKSGYIDTNIDSLIQRMHDLLKNKELAMKLSKGAKTIAYERFNIQRFTKDWENTFETVVNAKKNILLDRPIRSYKDFATLA